MSNGLIAHSNSCHNNSCFNWCWIVKGSKILNDFLGFFGVCDYWTQKVSCNFWPAGRQVYHTQFKTLRYTFSSWTNKVNFIVVLLNGYTMDFSCGCSWSYHYKYLRKLYVWVTQVGRHEFNHVLNSTNQNFSFFKKATFWTFISVVNEVL